MRIAFAIEHFCPSRGGAEQYAWGLAQWLTSRGHELHVYALEDSAEELPGAQVHVLDVFSLPFLARKRGFPSALANELKGERYDVVHGFNHVWPCDVLRLGGGVHLAYEYYNALTGRGPMELYAKLASYRVFPSYRSLRTNERYQFDDPHRHFIAVSQRVADDMAKYYPACRDRVHVIRNALDLDAYSPDRARRGSMRVREELGIADATVVFLFASNNYRLKGLQDIIAAFPRVRERLAAKPMLLVVGRDKERRFARQAKKAGVSDVVRFCGSADSLLGYYGAADVLLHPTYYDACANVCLEAMACGLPVLTSRNNGASEMMENGDGCVLVDMPIEREALADAICRTADPDFRSTARDAQWRRAQGLRIEDNYAAVWRVYEQIVAEKDRGA